MSKCLWISLVILGLGAAALAIFTSGAKSNDTADIFSDKPSRIVCLAPNLTEIAFALGLDKEIVAVSSDSDYPAAAKNKQKIGTFWQPNIEAIIMAKPDLVIALWFEQQKAIADKLKRMGYKVLILRIETITQLSQAIEQIGDAVGNTKSAQKLSKEINGQIAELKTKYNKNEKKKVLWVIQPKPLLVAGRNTFINELIELVGGQNAIGDTIGQYPLVDTEQILSCQADIIIQSAMGDADLKLQQKNAEELATPPGKYRF